ncbi:MAG: hypothetical protein U9R44_01605 [Candidatus Omnitrophota bacterium]|nr:hypothetical protein [Candidatus Omnitrophota bacterium]
MFYYGYLEKRLKEAGFIEIRAGDTNEAEHHDLEDWASMEIESSVRRFLMHL